MIGTVPERFSEAAPLLLPALRAPTSPPGAWERRLENPEMALLRRPFAPCLDICLILDLPEVRRFVHHGHLRRWGIAEDTAFFTAMSNLPPNTGLTPWPEAAGVWQLDARDGHVTSRLVLPGFLRSFAGRVPGRPVALVPDVQTLLIVGEDAGFALRRALDWTEARFQEAGTPISAAAYTADDAGVIPWIPADTHPLRQVAATRHRLHAGHEYRRQHAALVAWLAERGAPDVVAPYSLLKRGDSTVSFACWQDGPTLLPAVDFVVAGAPSQALSARWFPWSTLLDRGVLQDPEPDLAPVRYRVGRYPDDFRQGPVTMDPPGSLTGFPIS